MDIPQSIRIAVSIGAFICILAGLAALSRGLQSRNLSRKRKSKRLMNIRALAKGELKLASTGVLLLCVGTGLVGALILPDTGDGATPPPAPIPAIYAPKPELKPGRSGVGENDITWGAPTKDPKEGIPESETPAPRK